MLVRVHRYPTTSLFPGLLDFERDIDSLFEGFLARPSRQFPRVDISESENETVVALEMPGVKKEDVKVSFHNELLTISGKRDKANVPENARWIRDEIPSGEFARTIPLPVGVDPNAILAEMSNGILKVTLPKPEVMRPREIKVQ